jgi:hypothetical protein
MLRRAATRFLRGVRRHWFISLLSWAACVFILTYSILARHLVAIGQCYNYDHLARYGAHVFRLQLDRDESLARADFAAPAPGKDDADVILETEERDDGLLLHFSHAGRVELWRLLRRRPAELARAFDVAAWRYTLHFLGNQIQFDADGVAVARLDHATLRPGGFLWRTSPSNILSAPDFPSGFVFASERRGRSGALRSTSPSRPTRIAVGAAAGSALYLVHATLCLLFLLRARGGNFVWIQLGLTGAFLAAPVLLPTLALSGLSNETHLRMDVAPTTVTVMERTTPRQKPPGEFRVLLIGGSAANGTPYDEQPDKTITGRLNQFAARERSNIRVVNLAQGGYFTKLWIAYATPLAETLRPDLVLLYANVNSFYFEASRLSTGAMYGCHFYVPLFERGLNRRAYDSRSILRPTASYAALAEAFARRGVPLIVIGDPVAPWFSLLDRYREFRAAVKAVLAAKQVAEIDLFDLFLRPDHEFLFFDNCHLTEDGYFVAAQAIWTQLQRFAENAPGASPALASPN